MESNIRKAAISGLHYAAYLINYLGWEPCGPDSHLHLWSHIKVAAGKTALENGEHPEDVQALMGHILDQYLESNAIFDWEAQPGMTASEVHAALISAAQANTCLPQAA